MIFLNKLLDYAIAFIEKFIKELRTWPKEIVELVQDFPRLFDQRKLSWTERIPKIRNPVEYENKVLVTNSNYPRLNRIALSIARDMGEPSFLVYIDKKEFSISLNIADRTITVPLSYIEDNKALPGSELRSRLAHEIEHTRQNHLTKLIHKALLFPLENPISASILGVTFLYAAKYYPKIFNEIGESSGKIVLGYIATLALSHLALSAQSHYNELSSDRASIKFAGVDATISSLERTKINHSSSIPNSGFKEFAAYILLLSREAINEVIPIKTHPSVKTRLKAAHKYAQRVAREDLARAGGSSLPTH